MPSKNVSLIHIAHPYCWSVLEQGQTQIIGRIMYSVDTWICIKWNVCRWQLALKSRSLAFLFEIALRIMCDNQSALKRYISLIDSSVPVLRFVLCAVSDPEYGYESPEPEHVAVPGPALVAEQVRLALLSSAKLVEAAPRRKCIIIDKKWNSDRLIKMYPRRHSWYWVHSHPVGQDVILYSQTSCLSKRVRPVIITRYTHGQTVLIDNLWRDP